eukprot:15344179-Ditylum_brightwellii.AAC.1
MEAKQDLVSQIPRFNSWSGYRLLRRRSELALRKLPVRTATSMYHYLYGEGRTPRCQGLSRCLPFIVINLGSRNNSLLDPAEKKLLKVIVDLNQGKILIDIPIGQRNPIKSANKCIISDYDLTQSNSVHHNKGKQLQSFIC